MTDPMTDATQDSDAALPTSPEDLFAMLQQAAIAVTTVTHPPLFTVEDSRSLRGTIAGGHIKNLFIKDKKGNVFLLVVGEEASIDLKTVHQRIGGSGRVSFGKPELLLELLGVRPGSVSPFGLVNDHAGRVTCIFDEALMHHDVLNCHPLVNTMTTSIGRDDLLAFLGMRGHQPRIIDLSGPAPAA